MSLYNASVSIQLDDLCGMKQAADLYEYMKDKAEAAEGKNIEAVKDLEAKLAQAQKTMENLNATIADGAERLKAWEQAANAKTPVAAAHDFLTEHDTPFESDETDKACSIIRALLVSKETEAKPRELSPLFKQRVANAADVLRCMKGVVMSGNGELPAIEGDRYNTVLKTLADLHDVIMAELPEVMK